jgi:hypothetical protein
VQSAERETGRAGDRVLLGDADVETAVRVRPGERGQAGRVEPRFDTAVGRPVAGSNAGGLCRQSSSSASAGG